MHPALPAIGVPFVFFSLFMRISGTDHEIIVILQKIIFITMTWEQLINKLKEDFSITGDLLSVLFLIGVQESGEGFRKYDQQEKTDLVKLGKYTLLARAGYYERISVPGRDPLFVPADNHLLPSGTKEINNILKDEILHYFEDHLTV
jgi:hypothetical protein